MTPDFRDNELMARGVRIQAQSVDSQDDELPFTYFRPIRDRLYSWGFDAIKDAQAVMYLGRGDYDSYQIARNDLEDSGWLSPEIEINSLDKIPLGEYLQAGISKMKSTDWAKLNREDLKKLVNLSVFSRVVCSLMGKFVVMGERMAFRVQNLVLWYDGAILTERRSA